MCTSALYTEDSDHYQEMEGYEVGGYTPLPEEREGDYVLATSMSVFDMLL